MDSRGWWQSNLSHTLSSEGANQSLTGTCADLADNTTAQHRRRAQSRQDRAGRAVRLRLRP